MTKHAGMEKGKDDRRGWRFRVHVVGFLWTVVWLVIGHWSLVIFVAGCHRNPPVAPVEKPAAQPAKAQVVDATTESASASDPGPGLVPAKGELFAEWPKPVVALVVTGQQMGYIEPCGCTGLENQKGGLARRHT